MPNPTCQASDCDPDGYAVDCDAESIGSMLFVGASPLDACERHMLEAAATMIRDRDPFEICYHDA